MSLTVSSTGDSDYDTTQSTGDRDLEVMNLKEWRIRQTEDPVIGIFLRSVTQKTKPDMTDVPSAEAKYLLREFDHLVIRHGVLYRSVELHGEDKFQLVLPGKWREDAMRGAHDEVGHFGRSRGIAILRDRFYWPNMAADLANWIAKCELCILRKSPTSTAPLVSIHTSRSSMYGLLNAGVF